MFGWSSLRSTFEIEPSKPYFIFKSLFLARSIVSPPANYPWQELFKPPQTLIFFWSPSLQNLGLQVVPPSRKGGGDTDTVWWAVENIHDRFITPCFGWKVTSTLWSHYFFPCRIYPQPGANKRLEEVVVHYHLQTWLIGQCTGVFQGLIGH